MVKKIIIKLINFSIYLSNMKKTKKSEKEGESGFVSEICIDSENKQDISSIKIKVPKIIKKEKIFLTQKRERYKYSPEYYFSNNRNNNLTMRKMNIFNKKPAFNFFEKIQNPCFDYNIDNIHKNNELGKQRKITLIINNYNNIEQSQEKNEKKESQISSTSKLNYFESPSISTTNSVQMKSNQKDNFFPKNKFNIIKDSSEANSMKLEKILYKKRGRKSLKIGKRQHSALDDDNIIRKIQVHFISFIIDITNDLIRSVYPNNKNIYFKSINYEFKKTVNHSYIQGLLSKNIGEIVRLEASPKNKKFDKNINSNIYEKLCNNEIFKNYFQTSYLEMFNKYYYQEKKEIDVFGIKVNLSPRTKLFSDLLAKNISSEHGHKIIEIAEQYFVNSKKDSNPVFIIQKNESLGK